MADNTKLAVGSSGRGQGGQPCGDALSYAQNSTLPGVRHDAARCGRRRGVGSIEGDVRCKEVQSSRHLLHSPPAWAIDADILVHREQDDIEHVEVGDLNRGSTILDKITSEHVPQLIRSMDRESELAYADAQRCRWFQLAHCLVGVVTLVFLVYCLGATNPPLLEKILTLALTFVGGMGAGRVVLGNAKPD